MYIYIYSLILQEMYPQIIYRNSLVKSTCSLVNESSSIVLRILKNPPTITFHHLSFENIPTPASLWLRSSTPTSAGTPHFTDWDR